MCYRKRIRRGFTLSQLLLLLAILLILLALLLPAIVKARMAALRMKGTDNLKQLVLATQNFADTHAAGVPPTIGAVPPDRPMYGGEGTLHFFLLPYVELPNVYKMGNDGNIFRVSFKGTAATPVKLFLASDDPSAPPGNVYEGWLALCNYPANYLVFEKGGARLPGSIPDGTANTIFFAQRYQVCNGQPHAWGYDGWYYWAPMFAYYSTELFQVMPQDKDCDPERAQSLSPQGIQIGMGDGSVKIVTPKLSALTWLHACQPNDGIPLPADF